MANRRCVCALYTSNEKTHSTSEVRIEAERGAGFSCRYVNITGFSGLAAAQLIYKKREGLFAELIMPDFETDFVLVMVIGKNVLFKSALALGDSNTMHRDDPETVPLSARKGDCIVSWREYGSIIAPEMYLAFSGPLARTLKRFRYARSLSLLASKIRFFFCQWDHVIGTDFGPIANNSR